MRWLIALLMVSAQAHEMTPAHIKLNPAFVAGVSHAQFEIFNHRKDVEYYEIGVFDDKWEPIEFVSNYNLIQIGYLHRTKIDIYINDSDAKRAAFACSVSRFWTNESRATLVSSKICSKFEK